MQPAEISLDLSVVYAMLVILEMGQDAQVTSTTKQ